MKQQGSLFDEAPRSPAFPSRKAQTPPSWVPLAEVVPEGPPRQAGIARMAATAPEIDQRNDVEYRDLACRSLLTPCDSARMPFDYTINPYRGCEFGCQYCFARYTHQYMELETVMDFERKIFVKRGAREALLADLKRRDVRDKWIALGAATDPYQPAERHYKITREILEVLSTRRNLHLSITTKSDLVTRDLDLLLKMQEHSRVHVNVSITTPHHALSRRTEPRAPRPDKRFAAVKTLSAAGIRTGIFFMPVLPRINDGLEDTELMARMAKEAGAAFLGAQVLYLRACSRPTFFGFIRERFPELLPYYERLYGRGGESLAQYTRLKIAEIQAVKHRYGLAGARMDPPKREHQPDQLELWV